MDVKHFISNDFTAIDATIHNSYIFLLIHVKTAVQTLNTNFNN